MFEEVERRWLWRDWLPMQTEPSTQWLPTEPRMEAQRPDPRQHFSSCSIFRQQGRANGVPYRGPRQIHTRQGPIPRRSWKHKAEQCRCAREPDWDHRWACFVNMRLRWQGQLGSAVDLPCVAAMLRACGRSRKREEGRSHSWMAISFARTVSFFTGSVVQRSKGR